MASAFPWYWRVARVEEAGEEGGRCSLGNGRLNGSGSESGNVRVFFHDLGLGLDHVRFCDYFVVSRLRSLMDLHR